MFFLTALHNFKPPGSIKHDQMVHDATELKEQGNEKFKAKKYKLAQDKYEEALKILGGWQNGDIRTFRPKPKYEGIVTEVHKIIVI